jgi:hypothetical protein
MNLQWDKCWHQNQKLRTTGDLLPPRLMRGAIQV